MRKSALSVKIVIVWVQHPTLGALLIPYAAEDMPDGTLTLHEHGEHLRAPIVAKLTEVEQKAIRIASAYAERSLMKRFSKAPVLPVFFKKLTEDQLKKEIRPFIDKHLIKMLNLIRTEDIPLYQNEKGNKVLYKHSRIEVSPHYTDVLFDFETDNTSFHYSLQCKRDGETISLLEKKPVVTLTASPASLILGNELHLFQGINSMRILPFTNKPKVSVDVSETDKYLEKVVLPVLLHHEITFSGLNIFEEKRVCEPILSIEESIDNTTTLQLYFRYGDQTLYPGQVPHSKSAYTSKDKEGKVSLHFFYRDAEKEQRAMQWLRDNHLTQVEDDVFGISEDAPESDIANWMKAHREVLTKEFHLLSSNSQADYCIEEIRMEQEVTEKKDWFELHMIVVIGEFRIPFVRFRKHILSGKREYTLPDGRVTLLPEEWFSKYTDLLEHSEQEDTDEEKIRIKQAYIGFIEPIINDNQEKKK